MKKQYVKYIILIIIGSIFAAGGIVIFFNFDNIFSRNSKTPQILQNEECLISVKEETVIGRSMTGIIENGKTVKIFYGYYNCHEIQRGDIVIYNHPREQFPLIKVVKGIPNDSFSLKEENTESTWNILINGEVVKNYQGQPYVLHKKEYKVLSLYEKDYKGVIPEKAYLILGNLPQGSLDSSSFGLIGRGDILGKADIKK